jgi:hypothetical protein
MVVSRLFGFVVIACVFFFLSSDPSSAISPPSPSPPSLSNTFLDPHVVIQVPSALSLNYNSSLYQFVDPITSEIYSRIDSNFVHLFGQTLNETFLVVPPLNGSEAYVVMNGICRTLPSAYLTLIPSFQILQLSTYEGLQNVTQPSQGDRTVECQVWNFNHTLNFYIDNFHTSNLIRIEANTANLTLIVDFSPGFESDPSSLSPSSSVFQGEEILSDSSLPTLSLSF